MMDQNRPDDESALLERLTERLPDEVQPGRDLWPEIAARIRAPAPAAALRWWQSPFFVAASLIITTAALTYALTRPDMQAMPALAGQNDSVFELDSGFLADRQKLESELEGRISGLSPEMQTLVQNNLAEIRNSMSQINMALSNDPADPNLQDLMLSTYARELQLMSELAKIPATDARRIDL